MRVELSRLSDATESALAQLENERAARWSIRRIRGAASVPAYGCALDEFLVVNTEDASVHILLPRLGPTTAGRGVAYARTSAAHALVFEGAGSAKINGSATFTTAASVGRGTDLVNDGIGWWTS